MKMEILGGKSFDEFRDDFAAAMLTIEEKYGIDFRLGEMKYTDDYFTGKIRATKNGAAMQTNEIKYIQGWNRYAWRDDLDKDLLGKTFTDSDGKEFIVVGYRPRAKFHKIVIKPAKGHDGRSYTVATADYLKDAIRRG